MAKIPEEVIKPLKEKLDAEFKKLYDKEVALSKWLPPINRRHTTGAANQVVDAFIAEAQKEGSPILIDYINDPKNSDALVISLYKKNQNAVLNYLKNWKGLSRTVSKINVADTIAQTKELVPQSEKEEKKQKKEPPRAQRLVVHEAAHKVSPHALLGLPQTAIQSQITKQEQMIRASCAQQLTNRALTEQERLTILQALPVFLATAEMAQYNKPITLQATPKLLEAQERQKSREPQISLSDQNVQQALAEGNTLKLFGLSERSLPRQILEQQQKATSLLASQPNLTKEQIHLALRVISELSKAAVNAAITNNQALVLSTDPRIVEFVAQKKEEDRGKEKRKEEEEKPREEVSTTPKVEEKRASDTIFEEFLEFAKKESLTKWQKTHGRSVMVFGNEGKNTVVLQAIHDFAKLKSSETGAKEAFAELFRTEKGAFFKKHAEEINKQVNAVIKEKIANKTLTDLNPEPDDDKTTYKHKGTSLTQTGNDVQGYTFKPEGEFTGILRVQRLVNEEPSEENVDVVEYRKGKPITVSLATKGKCRIKNIGLMQEQVAKEKTKEVDVSGLQPPSGIQVVKGEDVSTPPLTPQGKPDQRKQQRTQLK
jgi:hypothetical protein